ALFLLTSNEIADKVLPELKQYQFEVLRTSLSHENEEQLHEMLGPAASAHAYGYPVKRRLLTLRMLAMGLIFASSLWANPSQAKVHHTARQYMSSSGDCLVALDTPHYSCITCEAPAAHGVSPRSAGRP